MIKPSFVLLLAILLVHCKGPELTVTDTFKTERYTYLINAHKKTKSLVIYIPDVMTTQLSAPEIFKLSKSNTVYVPFLADDNLIRQRQLDNLQNRRDFYSHVLQRILSEKYTHVTVVAEGINANLMSNIAFAYPIDELIFVNPFAPDIEQCLINTCFNLTHPSKCDSLLQHLGFTNRDQVENMITALVENGRDIQYGHYALSLWNDFFRLTCDPVSHKFLGDVHYIYTTNTGLGQIKDSLHTFPATLLNKELHKRVSN
jgi:hypothetical protein